jgi:hypothetical protein
MGALIVDRQLAYALANGVTGFREASGIGKERELVALREKIERGELLAPRLYISGTASGQNIPRYQASGLADLVRRLRDVGVDGIKLRNLTQAQADTAIRAAKEAGLGVFGHNLRARHRRGFHGAITGSRRHRGDAYQRSGTGVDGQAAHGARHWLAR